MKLSRFANLMVFGTVLTIAVAGCHKKPGYVTEIHGQKFGEPKQPENAPPLEPNKPPGEQLGGVPLTDPEVWKNAIQDREILKTDTVYFDYDSSVVKAGQQSKVSAVADYMKANPAKGVKIEGYCDERGTEEYNRSLGERRALAVREDLLSQGVAPGRIVTESFGKDRPAIEGHDEAAWSKNRRGEFVVLTKPGTPDSTAAH